MWTLQTPDPVKLIVGILASDEACLTCARDAITKQFGSIDRVSEVWPFTQTEYYNREMGTGILRQFVTMDRLMDPGRLAQIKHTANEIEQALSQTLQHQWPRPVNLDPGYIEPSKLVLASTKNFSHRIYIGDRMFAEVTLVVDRGQWSPMRYTFPDYRQSSYWTFFEQARLRLKEQLKSYPD
jgi:hypothetical protein